MSSKNDQKLLLLQQLYLAMHVRGSLMSVHPVLGVARAHLSRGSARFIEYDSPMRKEVHSSDGDLQLVWALLVGLLLHQWRGDELSYHVYREG